jgi:hypothetical protein
MARIQDELLDTLARLIRTRARGSPHDVPDSPRTLRVLPLPESTRFGWLSLDPASRLTRRLAPC